MRKCLTATNMFPYFVFKQLLIISESAIFRRFGKLKASTDGTSDDMFAEQSMFSEKFTRQRFLACPCITITLHRSLSPKWSHLQDYVFGCWPNKYVNSVGWGLWEKSQGINPPVSTELTNIDCSQFLNISCIHLNFHSLTVAIPYKVVKSTI